MADRTFARRICFAFLEDIKNHFFARYPEQHILSAVAFAMNEDFSSTLMQRMVCSIFKL
jgi:hypothetical protein